jgi:hypothetical protein
MLWTLATVPLHFQLPPMRAFAILVDMFNWVRKVKKLLTSSDLKEKNVIPGEVTASYWKLLNNTMLASCMATKILLRPIIRSSFICVRHGTSIPIILIQKIENRGEVGEIIQVKRGFARNYLIPRRLAGIWYMVVSIYCLIWLFSNKSIVMIHSLRNLWQSVEVCCV